MKKTNLLALALIIFAPISVFGTGLEFTGEIYTNKSLEISGEIICNRYEFTDSREGKYSYKSVGKDINLTGYQIGDSGVYLQEFLDGKLNGAFILSWQGSSLVGKWTNFKKFYDVTLYPTKSIEFQSEPDYSDIEFKLVRVPYSAEQANLYLQVDHHEYLPVGEVPTCDRDYTVDYARLTKDEDGNYELKIRYQFSGSAGEQFSHWKFNRLGTPIK